MKDVIEAVATPLLFLDKKRKIQFINSSFEKLTGYPKKELLGKGIEDVGLKIELKGSGEREWRRKDGSKLPVYITCNPMEENFLLTFENRTERSESIKKIKSAEDREGEIMGSIIRIGYLASKVIEGDLSKRVDVENLFDFIKPMGKNINRMIENIQKSIEEIKERDSSLESAISSFGKVLSRASSGDLTQKVDLPSISAEYKPIAEDINEMISATQQNIEELHSRTEVIKKSQEYTRSLFYSIPNPTSILDLEKRRIDTTKATEDLFRMSRDEILGSKVEDLYAKEDLKKIRETMERGKEGYSSCETTCIRGDGTEFPAVLSFAPVRDNDGNLINIVFSATDITELRSREEEVEERRAYFQNFFNSSPVPLTLIGLDGKRVDCNPAMERLTGRSKKELVYVPVEATYVKEEQELVRKKLVDETIEKGYMHGFETYFREPDGTKLPIVANTALIRDKKGRPLSIVYSATDITELRSREEEVEKTKEQIELIIETSPAPLILTDEKGRFAKVNRALERIVGYDRKEILGRTSFEQPFHTKETIDALRKLWEFTIKRREEAIESVDIPWRTKDGRAVIVRGTEAPFGTGESRLFAGIDVTESRKRELDLKSAISSFGSVLSSAASGNLKAKVDLSKIAEEYKPIGEDINSMISAIEESISELKKREREVREARLYAEAIIANISDPLWVVDKEDRWILVNEVMKKLTGYDEEEILKKKSTEQPLFKFFLNIPDSKEKLKDINKKIKENEHVAGMLIPWLTRDNKLLMMSCSGQPLKDAKGNVMGGVFIGKDMAVLQKVGILASKTLARIVEAEIGKNYEVATLLFMTNATMLTGDSSLDILKGVINGYNERFNKNVKIKDGLTISNMRGEDWLSFIEFLLETFYQCIGPTTFECSEGIKAIENIVEKVKIKHGS